jgi:uncharacterized protein (DUF1786 family)
MQARRMMPLCDINPTVLVIGMLLSAVAVLATLALLLRLMTLETAATIESEVAEIDAMRMAHLDDDPATASPAAPESSQVSSRRLRDMTLRQYLRLLFLVPSFALLLGSSTLLYMTTFDDCDFPDWDAPQSPGS